MIMRKKYPKNKKAAIEMSFAMIFSIILIGVFVAAAFFGIRIFLDYQKNVQIGMFINDLQNDIDSAYNAADSSTVYNGNLPTGVQYICFINWKNQTVNENGIETNLYNQIKTSGIINYDQNFYVYAPGKSFSVKAKQIKHIDLSKHNPICIKVINNKASVKITKRFDNPLVEVSE